MDAYTSFAEVYDLFMDNIPYKEWCGYLSGILAEYGIKDGLVLDMGCGTGNLTMELAACGYDMIGIDNSQEMLSCALIKREKAGLDILYLHQDMREFELYGTVEAVVCICDSINYILEYDELVQVFSLVNNYLEPGGIFIFDFNTEFKYRELLGDATIAEDREESSFIWENEYDVETSLNYYDLTLFIREEDGRYQKYRETHVQRAYLPEEIMGALKESGMEVLEVYDAFTRQSPKEESERVYVIARERGKKEA